MINKIIKYLYININVLYFNTIIYKFLRHTAENRGCPAPPFSHIYDVVLSNLNLQPLSSRRMMFDILLDCKIFKGVIPWPDVIQLFPLNAACRSPRNYNLLHSEQHRITYGYFNCVNRTAIPSNAEPSVR